MNKIKLPTIDLARIDRKKERIYSVLAPMAGQPVMGDTVLEVSRRLRTLLDNVPPDPLLETIRPLAGLTPSVEELRLLAWRLAANIPLLKTGMPVRAWTFQTADEWAPVLIIRGVSGLSRYQESIWRFNFRVLAGQATGLEPTVEYSWRACGTVARRLGYGRPRHSKLVFGHPTWLVGLHCFAHISAEKSREQPYFDRIECSGSFKKRNREVIKIRCRVKPCPRAFPHPCHQCAVGYLACPAGVHKLNYYQAVCVGCGSALAAFDPELSQTQCLNCLSRDAHARVATSHRPAQGPASASPDRSGRRPVGS